MRESPPGADDSGVGKAKHLGLMTRRSLHGPVLALAIAAAVSGCGGPITAGELGRSVDSIRSYAATGDLLAREIARHRTKTTFARVLSREMGERAEHEAEKLSDSRGHAPARDQAVQLAQDVTNAFGDLEVRPDDATVADKAAQTFREVVSRANALTARL
jgi:hypothetical protein